MDISVLISWKTVPRPVAWTIGRCPYCQGFEAIRIEDSVLVVSVYFLPIVRSPTGKQTASCDFCERQVELPVAMNRVDAASWEPRDGIESLATKLEMNWHALPTHRNHEIRMRSLLSAAYLGAGLAPMKVPGDPSGEEFRVPNLSLSDVMRPAGLARSSDDQAGTVRQGRRARPARDLAAHLRRALCRRESRSRAGAAATARARTARPEGRRNSKRCQFDAR